MQKFQLTGKELTLAVAIAILGFVFSTRQWILWMSGFNPFVGLFIYYVILYTALWALSKLGLTVFGIKINNHIETLGLLLISFSFFIIVDWESAYIQYVTTGSLNGISVVYLQSEDGAVFWIWQQLLPTVGAEVWRLLTYVLTPFVLTLSGGLLVSGKIKLA